MYRCIPQLQEQRNLIDGSASWWTQGLGHGDSSLALAAGAAAGRYGHVLFPDIVHEPALRLSQKLLSVDGPGYGWADRVFFTDDGSTAMEVAIKMGMRTFQERFGIQPESDVEWIVCAQQDCYHGDTLGVMDVEEPSIFNQNQHPWYQSKGLLLATPTLGFCDGALEISYPSEWGWPEKSVSCATLEEVMNIDKRLTTAEYSNYVDSIRGEWDDFIQRGEMVVASVVLEPILMGAGGMKFVDPLWQRAVMDIAKSRNIPIIFDEVAAGLYRVGVKSCRELLKCDPDIASYAKLLSGGLVPLSATLASKEVFDAFLGDEKSQALLHGHSYTAHPVGCVSSIHALECYEAAVSPVANEKLPLMKFDQERVKALSHLPLVEHSFSLGTVLAVTIRPEKGSGGGYAATSRTLPLIQKLRDEGVFVRPLGNVIYVMVSPITSAEDCIKLCDILHRTIERFGRELQLS
jgi:dethiobiotin synthetase/adenosylmethionine--8-amino-7-oxononanoate aminotransferase